jgi:DUF2934 family protein
MRPPAFPVTGRAWNLERSAGMQDLETSIRERAYQIWIDSGCEDGHADAHWLAAQREILSVSLSAIGRTEVCESAAAPKKLRSSRKKKRAA